MQWPFILFLTFISRVFCKIQNESVDKSESISKPDLRQVYANLKKTIESVKKSCGEICDQNIKGKPGKYFDQIKKNVDCEALFSNPDIDDPSQLQKPPYQIPYWLLKDYSYDGKVRIEYDCPYGLNFAPCYHDDSKGQNHINHWDQALYKALDKGLDTPNGGFKGPYGKNYTNMISDYMKNHMDLSDKNVLVVGSSSPWIELMAVRNGAKKVLSVDYLEIHSDHPLIETMSINELNKKYLDKSLTQFDFFISFSSLEHSGLGRYGDNLNPWGDVIAMARGWCLTKPGGKALIGVPALEKDTIYFNGSRHYGPVMYPHLFAN